MNTVPENKEEEENAICPGCQQMIDPTTCHCGSGEKDAEHGWYGYEAYTHPFVPMGCDCYRDKSVGCDGVKELIF
jgi:hypothetical protein